MRKGNPTIITAPNGAGKTHILMLLQASLSLELRILLASPFAEFRVKFDDGRVLVVSREVSEVGEAKLSMAVEVDDQVIGTPFIVSTADLEDSKSRLPSWIRKIGPDRWIDSRNQRIYGRAFLERRYRITLSEVATAQWEHSREVLELCSPPSPVFIDTKRLDVAGLESNEGEFGSGRTHEGAASRIHEYMDQLRAEVTEARRSSIQATQSADLSFAARALAAAKMTVKELDLHRRYDATVLRYETLARNSLAVGEAPMDFPAKTTPTDRRILSVFLDDWDKRLEPLLPLNEKIQTLREILDSKLAPSGKRTAMSARGDLEFRSASGSRIRVSSLSSGEQHLVALFTMLLFSANAGSLVLIDEPEISFHAAWKHAFLDDISRVAAISNLQVVLATHSSAIVNGRWDLTEELSYNLDSDASELSVLSASDDGEEFDE
ncbi:AAA family ATPase [Herbiconiux sp. UC225_62]|uniref:AAA family ATPase n=1 Tax=Herbiconiux sp. UC225_62 TaxID=3350168 RepID=UPI0036D273CF